MKRGSHGEPSQDGQNQMTILYTDDRFLDHETGTHRELLERNGIYARFHALQMQDE